MKIKEIAKKYLQKIDKHLAVPFFHPFRMSKDEKRLFESIVKHSKNYLEYGTGGSTFRVLKKSKAIVYSVDSSSEWINFMREYVFIKKMERKNRLTLIFVDIGKTGLWGHPVNEHSRKLFPNYSSKIFDTIDKNKLDTVLVDGRFRVACALKVIIECHRNKNLNILFHDFNRSDYHIVLNYLEETQRANTLRLFRIKSNISIDDVINDYERYKYISE